MAPCEHTNYDNIQSLREQKKKKENTPCNYKVNIFNAIPECVVGFETLLLSLAFFCVILQVCSFQFFCK